jgi:hypothetical protein
MKPLFKYIHDAKRFAKAYGELILPEGAENREGYRAEKRHIRVSYQPLSHPGTDKPRAPPKERKGRQTSGQTEGS